jgi:hypothetical protein
MRKERKSSFLQVSFISFYLHLSPFIYKASKLAKVEFFFKKTSESKREIFRGINHQDTFEEPDDYS